jgi:uncharacterized membrane protein YjgN (DUF898 family)
VQLVMPMAAKAPTAAWRMHWIIFNQFIFSFIVLGFLNPITDIPSGRFPIRVADAQTGRPYSG